VGRCAFKAHCALCASRGFPAGHRVGSGDCPPLRRARGEGREPATYADAVRRARGCLRCSGHNGQDLPVKGVSLGAGVSGVSAP